MRMHGSYEMLPYRDRLLINMLAICMCFFGHGERLTALMQLLYEEIDDTSASEEEFGDNTHHIAETMIMQRRVDHAA